MSDPVRAGLAALLKTEILPAPPRSVAGGCINECLRYETRDGPLFVKVASAVSLDAFEAEKAALQELESAHAVRTPRVRGVGVCNGHAVIALEWIDFAPPSAAGAAFGEQLARQHRVRKPLFGWKRANYIGRTPQHNLWSRDWVNFWRTHRFDAQINFAIGNGAQPAFIERATLLSALMDGFFTSYVPDASLLHGDLWSGNYAIAADGAPVIFDPALYYGDRECDLAMSRLFGGFGDAFYAAYANAWPLDPGWRERVDLYNLYHVLNHFNLFGGEYLSQANAMVERLLSELGH